MEMPQYLWDRFQTAKNKIEPERVIWELQSKGIKWLTREEGIFSSRLLQISNVPCILYYCGDISLLNKNSLGIVGSRKATPYGLKQAKYIAGELAAHGLAIVSGLARGVDGAAHEGALEAGGDTVAVLGSGLDIPYPRENLRLFRQIAEKGLLLSEFPPGTSPKAHHFPVRNRIISGIAMGVLVIEAEARSGSLITCDFALEQGKEIFALPGPVTSPNSIGPLRLIQNGAKTVIYPRDILEELGCEIKESLFSQQKEIIKNINDDEKNMLASLSWEPVHVDELLKKHGESYEHLLLLELKGLIKQLPGNYYIRV